MGYYSFDLTSLLSPRTSIGFHKRLKITRGRNKRWDQRPRLKTVSNDHNARDVCIELYIRDHVCRFFL